MSAQTTTKIQPGKKLSPEEARDYVNELYGKVYELSKKKIHDSPFMNELRAGKLPMPVIRQFYKNWGRYSLEVNGLNAVSYYLHLPFFVRHYDLLAPFCAKVADELISPEPPGHVLVLLKTGEKMQLSRQEILEDPFLPEARALNDFCHKIFFDGSIAELWALHAFEETLSRWSGEWFTALTTHYGFTKEQAVYFAAHEEADMKPHHLGQSKTVAMGHGPFNRLVFQRCLEDGRTESRTGDSLESCALTMIELQAQMKRAAMENPYP